MWIISANSPSDGSSQWSFLCLVKESLKFSISLQQWTHWAFSKCFNRLMAVSMRRFHAWAIAQIKTHSSENENAFYHSVDINSQVTTNYDVSPRVELTINAHTRITVLCYVFLAFLARSSLSISGEEGKLFNFFLLLLLIFSFEYRISEVNRNNSTAHVYAFLFYCELGWIVRLKYRKSLTFEARLRLAARVSFCRHHWANGGRRRIMKKISNINMCEHEQNFHALDVAFFIRFLFFFPCAIERSYLEFCVVWVSFMIRFSCLKRAADKTQGFFFISKNSRSRFINSRDCKICVNLELHM